MDTSEQHQQFLESQKALLGETPRLMAYGRVLLGPPGPSLVFVFVGEAAVYFSPAQGVPTLFGVPLRADKTPPPSKPVVLERTGVTFRQLTAKGWWARLVSPTDTIEVVHDPGGGYWRIQLFQPAAAFIGQWAAFWKR